MQQAQEYARQMKRETESSSRRTEDRRRSRNAMAVRTRKAAPLRRDVVQAVKDSNGLRKAFLYMEILGAPVSMRREQSILRFWEQ